MSLCGYATKDEIDTTYNEAVIERELAEAHDVSSAEKDLQVLQEQLSEFEANFKGVQEVISKNMS